MYVDDLLITGADEAEIKSQVKVVAWVWNVLPMEYVIFLSDGVQIHRWRTILAPEEVYPKISLHTSILTMNH